MNLTFDLDGEDDVLLNTTIRDSETGSIMYTAETPTRKYTRGSLTTTVKKRNLVDGSTRFAFRILWKGEASLKDVILVLDRRTMEEVPVREVLESAPGSST
jgi:hypothetical protein